MHLEPDLAEDEGLLDVLGWFRRQAHTEQRFGAVLRQSIDEVLDGQRTGRFDLDLLESTEKTYLGTKVEIVARSAFQLDRGDDMDYSIAGHEVDAKFTSGTKSVNWTIPIEAMGHLCLLMAVDDRRSKFRVGLVRITDDALNAGRNRDGKRSLNITGRARIRWLVAEGDLPRNLLLGLPQEKREAIFRASDGYRGGGNGGQLRTNELFRQVQEQIVDRNTLVTVASQEDGLKRARDARKVLREEGILILGHQNDHPRIARALDLPVPAKGTFVAVRLAPAPTDTHRPCVEIGRTRYVAWREGDDRVVAPSLY
ncbi:NaeI family type II restriction endonuclease [Streptacidiphilus neutrinimicus]|uniref:NaeI family type II restriction endonuclease n=1 Tax=Streptacidiphilus neutrinimicus TaxID=105420 RepID=UPI0006934307|nr:NaeI family type II restriction endonuclease [Streptacidiphilus neutrinimicus]